MIRPQQVDNLLMRPEPLHSGPETERAAIVDGHMYAAVQPRARALQPAMAPAQDLESMSVWPRRREDEGMLFHGVLDLMCAAATPLFAR